MNMYMYVIKICYKVSIKKLVRKSKLKNLFKILLYINLIYILMVNIIRSMILCRNSSLLLRCDRF